MENTINGILGVQKLSPKQARTEADLRKRALSAAYGGGPSEV